MLLNANNPKNCAILLKSILASSSKPLYTIEIVSFMMNRLFTFVMILIVISLFPVQGGSNITQRAVYLNERVVLIKFVNMGVDAYWGNHILDNAASALPILEDLIGVPLPSHIESIEIYGRRDLIEEWMLGYNDGNLVALKTDHPDPTIVFHELVHFWTTHYSIPWPLAEGYCNLYADLCAIQLGLNEVAYSQVDWEEQYYDLEKHQGKTPLNDLNYGDSQTAEIQREYFYLASTVIMFNFYETVGEESLRAINQQVAQSSLDGTRSGIGIIQYLRIVKEVTDKNYANLFMPVILAEWEPEHEQAFQEGVGRYCAVSELTQVPDSDENMQLALTALLKGKFSDFQATEQAIVVEFYAEQKEVEEEEIPQETLAPPEEKGLLHNRLFLMGIAMLVVVVILLVYILSKIAKEEEEYEWEVPRTKEAELWISPPEQPPTEELVEELPEIPDLEELTK